MTIQIPDELKMDGELWNLKYYYPIESLLEAISPQTRFDDSSSALNRGTVATWMIEDDRLYLIELLSGCRQNAPSVLNVVFPGSFPPILATWYSGPLSLYRGQLVEYGITSHFHEHEASLTVEAGVITAKKFIQRDQLLPGQKPLDRTGII